MSLFLGLRAVRRPRAGARLADWGWRRRHCPTVFRARLGTGEEGWAAGDETVGQHGAELNIVGHAPSPPPHAVLDGHAAVGGGVGGA
jgi:hypothetical protein